MTVSFDNRSLELSLVVSGVEANAYVLLEDPESISFDPMPFDDMDWDYVVEKLDD